MPVILSQLFASQIHTECVKNEHFIVHHGVTLEVLLSELLDSCQRMDEVFMTGYPLIFSTCVRLLECEYGHVSEHDLQVFLQKVMSLLHLLPSMTSEMPVHEEMKEKEKAKAKEEMLKRLIPSLMGEIPAVIAPSLHSTLLTSLTTMLTTFSSSSSSSSPSSSSSSPSPSPVLTGVLYLSLAMVIPTSGEALSTSGAQFLPPLFAALSDKVWFVRQSAERFGFLLIASCKHLAEDMIYGLIQSFQHQLQQIEQVNDLSVCFS